MTEEEMLFDRARNSVTFKRDDIEQALSWYYRMPSSEITFKDREVFESLHRAVAKMRSMGIGDE